MKNIVRNILGFIVILLGVSLIPSYSLAEEVYDEELTALLDAPVVKKTTLPDGSVISTVTIGNPSNGGTSAGYITLPLGGKIKFTKSAGTTTFVDTSNGSTSVCTGSSCSGNSTVLQSVGSALSEINTTDGGPTKVVVTEKIPGSTCVCFIGGTEKSDSECDSADVQDRLYQCSVGKGMTSFQNIIREITKWFIYITMLLGVLALVGAGILWAWGSESEEYTKKAKGWAVNIIIGLLILFTFRYILGFLAPWIFK